MTPIELVSIILASIALLIGCVSISLIVGLMRSTHQVVWKEFKPQTEELQPDPFLAPEPELDLSVNPNKRIKPEPVEPKEEEPFLDLDDPNETSNEW